MTTTTVSGRVASLATRPGSVRPGLRRTQRMRQLTALAMLAPALLGLAIFFVFPLLASVVFSFTRYDLLSDPQWVGLLNYEYLFTNCLLYTSDAADE